jgi:hypothetical protein
MKVARRELLTGASGIALAFGTTTKPAEAQFAEIRAALSELFYFAVETLEEAIDALAGIILNADGFVDDAKAESDLRQSIAALSEISSSDYQQVARTEFVTLVDQIVENEAVAAPDPSAVDAALVAAESDRSADTWQNAITDIMLESMGLDQEARDSLSSLLKFADVASDFNALRDALMNGDWAKVTQIIERIVRKVFSRSVISEVVESVDDRIARQLLRALSARAVPFLGWAWFAAALSLAIIRNRDRLLELAQ